MTSLFVVVAICIAIGRVTQHGYVAAVTAGFMLVMGLLWPWFILRFVSAFSRTSVVRSRVGMRVALELDVRCRWPIPLPGIEIQGSPAQSFSIDAPPITLRRGRQSVPIRIMSQRRGVFSLSVLAIGTSFPFGLWHAGRVINGSGRLIIWPTAEPVDVAALRGASRTLAVDFASSRISAEGELAGVRWYRRGDTMRGIHWQQTARHDRLVVRERAGGERRGCIVCLDTRRDSYDDEETFERAVSITSGAIEQSLSQGLSLELRIGHTRLPIADDRELANALDALAGITRIDATELHASSHGLLITTAAGWASVARKNLQLCLVNGVHP